MKLISQAPESDFNEGPTALGFRDIREFPKYTTEYVRRRPARQSRLRFRSLFRQWLADQKGYMHLAWAIVLRSRYHGAEGVAQNVPRVRRSKDRTTIQRDLLGSITMVCAGRRSRTRTSQQGSLPEAMQRSSSLWRNGGGSFSSDLKGTLRQRHTSALSACPPLLAG